jgi:rhamnogalacturonyl hydrolase YesR
MPGNGWNWSTYADGLHAAYLATGDPRYRSDLLAWGRASGWAISTAAAEPDPNSLKAAQTYFDLHRLDPAVPLAAADTRLAADLAGQPESAYDWIDAFFMGLPVWTRWAARTGDGAYLVKLDALYRWARDDGLTAACAGRPRGLHDPDEQLWYRDCKYIGARDSYGSKVFWSRGNGWVLAGLAEVLAMLPPDDLRAASYRTMFAAMAQRVAGLQGEDGLWRPSLLQSALLPQPETSGTALFAYAIAAGVRSGVLDRATYAPVLARAWHGLTTVSLRPNGFLSNCQGVGDSPQPPYVGDGPSVPATDRSPGTLHRQSPPFCVGAFLLAAGELAALTGPAAEGAR